MITDHAQSRNQIEAVHPDVIGALPPGNEITMRPQQVEVKGSKSKGIIKGSSGKSTIAAISSFVGKYVNSIANSGKTPFIQVVVPTNGWLATSYPITSTKIANAGLEKITFLNTDGTLASEQQINDVVQRAPKEASKEAAIANRGKKEKNTQSEAVTAVIGHDGIAYIADPIQSINQKELLNSIKDQGLGNSVEVVTNSTKQDVIKAQKQGKVLVSINNARREIPGIDATTIDLDGNPAIDIVPPKDFEFNKDLFSVKKKAQEEFQALAGNVEVLAQSTNAPLVENIKQSTGATTISDAIEVISKQSQELKGAELQQAEMTIGILKNEEALQAQVTQLAQDINGKSAELSVSERKLDEEYVAKVLEIAKINDIVSSVSDMKLSDGAKTAITNQVYEDVKSASPANPEMSPSEFIKMVDDIIAGEKDGSQKKIN